MALALGPERKNSATKAESRVYFDSICSLNDSKAAVTLNMGHKNSRKEGKKIFAYAEGNLSNFGKNKIFMKKLHYNF